MITLSARCEFRWLELVGQLDVRELGATDDQLLLLGRQGIPGAEVVQVFLDDHVAAARECGILIADHDGFGGGCALGILGSVDEPEHVAFIEGAKAVHLVDHLGAAVQPFGQPLGQLETQVESVSSDVEQQVTRRRHGAVARTGELAERMQPRRRRAGGQPIP